MRVFTECSSQLDPFHYVRQFDLERLVLLELEDAGGMRIGSVFYLQHVTLCSRQNDGFWNALGVITAVAINGAWDPTLNTCAK